MKHLEAFSTLKQGDFQGDYPVYEVFKDDLGNLGLLFRRQSKDGAVELVDKSIIWMIYGPCDRFND